MIRKPKYKHRPVLHWAVFVVFFLGVGTLLLAAHPETPLPRAWNPLQPLHVSDPITPLTPWKMARTLGDDQICLAALATGATMRAKPDFSQNDQCHIRPQVELRGVGDTKIKAVNTRCQTALRLAMWTQHGLEPAARTLFDSGIARVEHFSSYNCRAMRTSSGTTGRMSSHATADAIDVSGFTLKNGTRISLLKHWDDDGNKAAFLRQANISACDWFRLTLGPDYNALHADHFHLQNTGWGLCR